MKAFSSPASPASKYLALFVTTSLLKYLCSGQLRSSLDPIVAQVHLALNTLLP
jgi:hypothetical protein